MRAQFLLRIRILAVVIVLYSFWIFGRLYFLQIANGSTFREQANRQYVHTSQNIFDRGAIYFTRKDGERIAAATIKTGYFLAIKPNKIKDVDFVYNTLSKYIELDEEDFKKRANKKDDPYEEVAKKIDEETAKKIRNEDLTGVQLFKERWRYYPAEETASHALGFVGYGKDGNVLTGRYGLERYWDSVLSREGGNFRVNLFAEIFNEEKKKKNNNEEDLWSAGDVVTSIEPEVQQMLDRVLLATEEKWHAKHVGGIIMNPQNGEIYAMSAIPSFNPNSYSEVKNMNAFHNPFVEYVYEMGSIIKPIAMAIGLDTGAVTPKTTYSDTGSRVIDGSKISNYDGRARGVVDMQEVLNQSLNLGVAFVADRVGGKTMGTKMKEFGFGEETGIDLPFEVRGLVDNLNSPRKIEYATASFGQGIALTPIETVRALSALGNGGYLVTPHFVTKVIHKDGTEANVAPDDKKQVIKKETSEEITRMLVNVVDVALKRGKVKKEHYSIGAKTGTAQIANVSERGYYSDRYLHSFFGYFPAYDPKYIIFLYHVEPVGARYASQTLTDPFMEIVDFLINYYNVPPDR